MQKSARTQTVKHLRDAALDLVSANYDIEKHENLKGPVFVTSAGGLQILLRTPMAGRIFGSLPYGLDVWSVKLGKKVLNVEWDYHDTIEIVSFRRGDWETQLRTFAEELGLSFAE